MDRKAKDKYEYHTSVFEDKRHPSVSGAAERLRDLCFEKARELFGCDLPDPVRDRLEKELKVITGIGDAGNYLANREAAVSARNDGNPVAYSGKIGGSLAAYLCGMTDVDPLPAYYVCPGCNRYMEPENAGSYVVGADLPDLCCPDCGALMRRSGFDIPEVTLFGIHGDRLSNIYLEVPEDHAKRARDKAGDPATGADIAGTRSLQMLKELAGKTGVDPRRIPLDDKRSIGVFSSCESLEIEPDGYILTGGVYGIPDFDNEVFRDIAGCVKPATVSDLIKCYGLMWGLDSWNDKTKSIILSGKTDIGGLFCSREDIYTALCNKGMDHYDAYEIMDHARKYRGLKDAHIQKMMSAGVPEWWIDYMKDRKIYSMRALDVIRVITGIKLAWFKVNHPREFYQILYEMEARGVAPVNL